MKLLIVDTRTSDRFAELFFLDENDSRLQKIRLGDAPEIHYNRARREVVVVDTELSSSKDDKPVFWLKSFSADTMELLLKKETPTRPMYTGYGGRSTRIKSSSSGRFLYFLELAGHPSDLDIYRILTHRYDYETGQIEKGRFHIDSCMLDFDQFGADENELCFHLSCEFPSTVVFGEFGSPHLAFLSVEKTQGRTPSNKETCGSWFSKTKRSHFCITGEGSVYEVSGRHESSKLVSRLMLANEESIPLHQIVESAETLLIGVSRDMSERGLSLASQIWRISTENGEVLQKIELPFPVINFIATPDDYYLVGVSPYQNAIVLIESNTGKLLGVRGEIGVTPAEVLAVY